MTRQAHYVGWLQRHLRAIFAASALLAMVAGYLVAFHLPLRSDFSHLLPGDAPSVKAFAELARRMPARDTTLVVVVAPDPASRAAVADRAIAAIRALDRDLVAAVDGDDAATRAFLREHRHLLLPLADLEAARAALADKLADARRRANPLYVELDDPPAGAPAVDELRARQRAAEARLDRPRLVSADGRTQAIVVRTAFPATDVDRDHRLQGELDRLAAALHADHPGVQLGFTGGVTTTVAEHRALVRGVLLSTLITGALVALVLFVHLRDLRLLALLTATIAIATVVAFGIAAITVGQLNAATAFLGAIVAGNGINYGILLVARYLEERRARPLADALATAIAGTLRPTLVASLGAAIAYGALGATRFRGFAEFALIGGVGMLVCWIASFVLLPALVLRFAASPRGAGSPLFGRAVVRLFGFRRPALVCAASALALAGACALSWRYLAGDPYEYDMTQLRSQAPDAIEARRWMRVADREIGRGLAGIAGQTYLAADHVRDVPAIVGALRATAARDPIVGAVSSILDVVPPDQPRKLAVLGELRDQLDEIAPLLDDAERAELAALRPPDRLAAITAADLPRELADKLTERDGQIGRMIAVRPGAELDEYDGRDLIRFADAVRRVQLPDGRTVTAAGGSLLFADVLVQIRRDGPLVTALAALGLVAMVVLVVGRNRRSAAVLAATAAGSVGMIAACALAGLKINFLDFVALPITLGLGIDYAINVADRAAGGDPVAALRSTGGTVLVCSLTTTIGYASLLVSDNLAIRGFGLASLIGELTCVLAALVIVPAIMALRLAPRLYPGAASSGAW